MTASCKISSLISLNIAIIKRKKKTSIWKRPVSAKLFMFSNWLHHSEERQTVVLFWDQKNVQNMSVDPKRST